MAVDGVSDLQGDRWGAPEFHRNRPHDSGVRSVWLPRNVRYAPLARRKAHALGEKIVIAD